MGGGFHIYSDIGGITTTSHSTRIFIQVVHTYGLGAGSSALDPEIPESLIRGLFSTLFFEVWYVMDCGMVHGYSVQLHLQRLMFHVGVTVGLSIFDVA